MLCNTDMPFKWLIYRMRSPHVVSISVFRLISIVHACCCVAIPFPFRVCVHARLTESVAHVLSHAVQYRYAIRICSFIVCNHRMSFPVLFPVVQSCSCMFWSCHSVSIPFLISCSSVIIPSTLLRGLLMESILHHLAGRHVSTEQQRS